MEVNCVLCVCDVCEREYESIFQKFNETSNNENMIKNNGIEFNTPLPP